MAGKLALWKLWTKNFNFPSFPSVAHLSQSNRHWSSCWDRHVKKTQVMREMRMRNKKRILRSFKPTVSLRQGFSGARLIFTKPFLFFSGDSGSQQHLSHTHVLVLQEPGSGGSVSGGRRCRSGGEDQTAHRKRHGKQRGLGHSKGIREWTKPLCWKFSVVQVQDLILSFYKLSIQHFRNSLFHYLASLAFKVFPSSVECKEWCLTEKRQENTAFVMKLDTEKPISAKCINVSWGVASKGHVCTVCEC